MLFRSARALGRGVGYRYPHAEGGFVAGQRHLPEDLAHLRFYEPTAMGFEARLGEILGDLRAQREEHDAPPEKET